MAASKRGSDAPLIARLLAEPHRFTYFQAMRILLALQAEETAASSERPARGARYADDEPSDGLRMVGHASQAFPAAELHAVMPAPERTAERATASASDVEHTLAINLFGFVGPQGVLPAHVTQEAAERRRHSDTALADFLDLFLQRSAFLFFRAWQKHRLPFVVEERRRAGQVGDEDAPDDHHTRVLLALIGLGTPGLRRRMTLDDELLLGHGARLAARSRTAGDLAALLGATIHPSARVAQFVGQWLELDSHCQTRLCAGDATGANARLGSLFLLGDRTWDVTSGIRLRFELPTYREFASFLPDSPRFRTTVELARCYVGAAFDVDVQLVLPADRAPALELRTGDGLVDNGAASGEHVEPRLGWNTWLLSSDRPARIDDAHFADETTCGARRDKVTAYSTPPSPTSRLRQDLSPGLGAR